MTTTHLDRESLAPPAVADFGDGLFAYIQPNGSWMINNTGFLVANDGVICIDSCATERRTRAFINAIATKTDLPVRTILNTHSHADHVAGNSLFPAATILAHEDTRESLLGFPLSPSGGVWEPVDSGDLTPAPPFVTFRDPVSIWLDDVRCEVHTVTRPAHTTSDTIVWVPQRKVLYAGDLVLSGVTPCCLHGSVVGSIAVLTQEIVPLGPDLIVPGHGAICDLDMVRQVLGYLELVMALAGRGMAAGLSPLELARSADLGDYAAWTDPERIVGNLHRAYADLRGESLTPAETCGAMTDMVAYNGNRPLTCLA